MLNAHAVTQLNTPTVYERGKTSALFVTHLSANMGWSTRVVCAIGRLDFTSVLWRTQLLCQMLREPRESSSCWKRSQKQGNGYARFSKPLLVGFLRFLTVMCLLTARVILRLTVQTQLIWNFHSHILEQDFPFPDWTLSVFLQWEITFYDCRDKINALSRS